MAGDLVTVGVQYMAAAMTGSLAAFKVMHTAFPTLFGKFDVDLAAAYDKWKLDRAEKVGRRIAAVAADRKMAIPTKVANASVLYPLLEAAMLEEDDDLSEHWAQMFVNAVDADNKVEIRRAYVSIFQDCTRLDVRILATLFNVPDRERGLTVLAEYLPDKAIHDKHPDFPHPRKHFRIRPDVVRSLWNLVRLGLVSAESVAEGDSSLHWVTITSLGVGLVEACTSPRA